MEFRYAQPCASYLSHPGCIKNADRLHPRLSDVYKAKVADLQCALDDDAIRSEAAAILRGQIDRIVLTPGEGGSLDAELHGDLAGILALCEGRKCERPGKAVPGRRLSVVAGARINLYRTSLIWQKRGVSEQRACL